MGEPLSCVSRALLTLGSAAITLRNPARADTLALLGDLTSQTATRHLIRRLERSASGREMLLTLQPARFPEHGSASLPHLRALPDGSLGREYARFMDSHGFTPEQRAPVREVHDAQQRWVLQRYRDVHDLWHVLSGLPTTLAGETAQKMLEAAHTRLPVAALSVAGGLARVRGAQRQALLRHALPWALTEGACCEELLALRYERFLAHDVQQLRQLWRLRAPPVALLRQLARARR
eukprot:TRINITY_DN1144_c0_g1_i1.p1 TRINITY_DN1144_c0_g1~~TRINITY_DN1144_c0_g1_i1.p1  ORF type:complete len:235 (-),score=62.60 TRINITY_DN1144_c0_g1_i1:154-858(-)